MVADSALKAGQTSTVTISFSEAVTGLTADDFVVGNGSLSGLSSSNGGLTWTATLTPTAGVESTTNLISLDGSRYTDLAGNAASGTANSGNYAIDARNPGVSSLQRADASPSNASTLHYTLKFSEAVNGLDAGDLLLSSSGTASGRVASVIQIDASTYSVLIDQISGTGNLQLALKGSGTGISDAAGNPLGAGFSGEAYAVDRDAPGVTAVHLPAAGTYGAGAVLDFSLRLSEPVQVDTSQGTPRLAFMLENGSTVYADYLSSSGDTLNFRYVVQDGQRAPDGITLAGFEARGAVLRDAVGNALQTSLPATDGRQIVVNAVAAPVLPPEPAPSRVPAPPAGPLTQPIAPLYTIPTDSGGQMATGASGIYTYSLPPSNPLISVAPSPTPAPMANLSGGAPGNSGFSAAASPEVIRERPLYENSVNLLTTAPPPRTLSAMPDLGSMAVNAGQRFSIALPANAFSMPDSGAPLVLSARLANGRPLPAWLSFDPTTGTLSGQVPPGVSSDLLIDVQARDADGNEVKTQLKLDIQSTKDQRSEMWLIPDAATADRPSQLAAPGKPSLAAQFDQFGRHARQQEAAQLLHHLQEQAKQHDTRHGQAA